MRQVPLSEVKTTISSDAAAADVHRQAPASAERRHAGVERRLFWTGSAPNDAAYGHHSSRWHAAHAGQRAASRSLGSLLTLDPRLRLTQELRPSSHAIGTEVCWSREFRGTWEPDCFRCSQTFAWWAWICAHPKVRRSSALKQMDLGREACCRQLIDLLRADRRAVRHSPGLRARSPAHRRSRRGTHVADQRCRHGARDGSDQRRQSHRRQQSGNLSFPAALPPTGRRPVAR